MADELRKRARQMLATLKRRKNARDVPTLNELAEFLSDEFRGGARCPYCLTYLTPADASLDHLEPLSRGGSARLSNSQVVCKQDNKSKGDFSHEEYVTLLKKLAEAEEEARNFTMKAKVLTALRVAQSFRQGANRRAKR